MDIVDEALQVLEQRMKYRSKADISNQDDAIKYFRLRLRQREHEVFAVLFLDNRHRVIDYQELFRGTINGATVHVREVAKESLKRNAAALIVAHNHPSGVAEPSRSDIAITQRLKEGLGLLDVRLLDHIIVGEREAIAFSDRGLM